MVLSRCHDCCSSSTHAHTDIFLQPINRSHFLLHSATHLNQFRLKATQTNMDSHTYRSAKSRLIFFSSFFFVDESPTTLFPSVPPSHPLMVTILLTSASSPYFKHNRGHIFLSLFSMPLFVSPFSRPLVQLCPPSPPSSLFLHASSSSFFPAPLLSFSTLLLFSSSVSQPAV